MCDVCDVVRAMTTNIASPTSATHGAIDPLSVEAPSAFVGARKDCEIRTGRYPTTLLASGVKFSAPDFGAYVEPTRGRQWVACVARARASPTSRLGHSRYSSPSLRRPLCVRRRSRGLKNRTGPLSHYKSANRCEHSGQRCGG